MSKTFTLNMLSKFGNRINMIGEKVKISNGLKTLWILEEKVKNDE
ncbi:MAG: hypothetical protein ABIK21_09110 [bacterium]